MIRRTLLLLLLAACAAPAQLQLLTVPAPGEEELAPEQFDFGEVPTGDFRDIRLRLRNTGEATATLSRLRASGVGFTLEGHPSLPHLVAPGMNVDFRLRFRPSGEGFYSGTLRVNDTFYMIFGSSPPTLTLLVRENDDFVPLQSENPVVFGQAKQGESIVLAFRLENPSRTELTLTQLQVTSGMFAIRGAPPLPAAIAPGAAVDFEIAYTPRTAGIHRSLLLMNDQAFPLEGVGLNPPFPAPEIVFESATLESGRQSSVSVKLAEPSPASGSGTLRMSFIPAVASAIDDPAVFFLANSDRTLALTVQKGSDLVQLAGAPSALFQTGTTAGAIEFTVELGDHLVTASVNMPVAPVQIDNARWSPTQTGLRLDVTGFDNSRSAGDIAFTFFDASGRALTPEPIRAHAADAFRGYFSANPLGGVFLLEAEFPVAGNLSLLGAVEIQFVNDAGPSLVQRLQLTQP